MQRIESLLEAGWQEVRVVTDHGWLLMPKGLPKCELAQVPDGDPLAAVCGGEADRHGRTALLLVVLGRGRADRLPAWDRLLHGGRGVQPRGPELAGMRRAAVRHPTWQNGHGFGDNRVVQVGRAALPDQGRPASSPAARSICETKPADPATSLTGAKAVGKDGTVSLVVADDSREGTATTLVLLDPAGNVIDKSPVTVGG